MQQTRPPIIAVVGHIDHGKSKLQQALRKMDTAKTEAGDITQHIGAYEINTLYEGTGRRATILDTPGHEAFSHIREHGLNLTDLALLVVSAEDGWKEQTAEAYAVIQKKNIPHIVVFTKIDTDRADLERAKQSVMQQGLLLEGLGGQVPWIAVSSVTNQGIPELVELIFLTTDIYEIVQERVDASIGILVEADIDPQTGIAGTVIVLNGKLESGGFIRVGASIAPLRIMEDDHGAKRTVVEPSTPVRVIGFDSIPPIGESVFHYPTKKEAVEDAKQHRPQTVSQTLNESKQAIELVLRSDTASGLTSIEQALSKIPTDGISFVVIKKEIGAVTEEDVRLANTGDSRHVVGFHTIADLRARQLAERSETSLHLFPTIYELIDWATEVSKKKKEGYEITNPTGTATIIRIFDTGQEGTHIIGAEVIDGTFSIGQDVMIRRNGENTERFTIVSIEMRSVAKENVSGVKTQFAMRISGNGSISEGDTALALPKSVV